MRYQEIAGGIRIPLSLEEYDLVTKISKLDNKYLRSNMTEREQEVSRKLLSRGVLNFFTEENEYFFEVNKLEEIERY